MRKPVRRVWLASSVLLLCAAGSCYVGEWQDQKETEQLEKWMEASGLYISHAYPGANVWEILGLLLLLAGVSVAFAAVMLWKRGPD